MNYELNEMADEFEIDSTYLEMTEAQWIETQNLLELGDQA